MVWLALIMRFLYDVTKTRKRISVKTKKSPLLQAAMEDESVVAPRDGLEPPTQ